MNNGEISMNYKKSPFEISKTINSIFPILEMMVYIFEYIVWNTDYEAGRSQRNYCVFRQ